MATPAADNMMYADRRDGVTHATTNPATTLNTRTTRHPSGVTSAWKFQTPSARAPISRCAAALSGRHGVPDRRPTPSSSPATAAKLTSPAKSARPPSEAEPVRAGEPADRWIMSGIRQTIAIGAGREVGPESKRARRSAGAFVNRVHQPATQLPVFVLSEQLSTAVSQVRPAHAV